MRLGIIQDTAPTAGGARTAIGTGGSASPASHPPGLPLLGHLPWFLHDRLGFLERCARTYGEVVRLHLGGETLLLTNPEDIRHVLVTNPENYEKTPRLTSRSSRVISGEGLLTASTGAHMRERRMLQPVFYRNSMGRFARIMTNAAEDLFSGWHTGATVDVAEAMGALAQSVIIRTVFGDNYSDRDSRLRGALQVRKQYLDHVFFSLLPLAPYIPPWLRWRYGRAMRVIRATIARELEARKDVNPPTEDLLTMLMRARYEDGSGMSDRRISDETMILLITGYESIGDALAWTLYVVSQHPEVERRLSDEVTQTLSGRTPSAADLYALPYATRVIAETLRLYPPSWIMVRVAGGPDRLPSGAFIPKGAKLYLCQYVMHRHPAYYPDPERFDPDRFTEASKKARPQFAYFPFGGGARVCIGEHFARLEAILVLAMAVQRFKFRLAPGHTVVPQPRMTLRPKNGLRMYLEPR